MGELRARSLHEEEEERITGGGGKDYPEVAVSIRHRDFVHEL